MFVPYIILTMSTIAMIIPVCYLMPILGKAFIRVRFPRHSMTSVKPSLVLIRRIIRKTQHPTQPLTELEVQPLMTSSAPNSTTSSPESSTNTAVTEQGLISEMKSMSLLAMDTLSLNTTGSDVKEVRANLEPGEDLVTTETTSVWGEKLKMDKSNSRNNNKTDQVTATVRVHGERILSKSLPNVKSPTTLSTSVDKIEEVDPFDPDAFMLERPVGTLDDSQEYEVEIANKLPSKTKEKNDDADAGDHLYPVTDKDEVLLPFSFKEYGLKKNVNGNSKENNDEIETDIPSRSHSKTTERTRSPKTCPRCSSTPSANRDIEYSEEERKPKRKKSRNRSRSNSWSRKKSARSKNRTNYSNYDPSTDIGVMTPDEVTQAFLDTLENDREISPYDLRSEKETYVPSSQPYFLPKMQLSFAPPSLEDQEEEMQEKRTAQIPTKIPGIHLPIASITLSTISEEDSDFHRRESSRQTIRGKRKFRSEPTLEDDLPLHEVLLHKWRVNHDFTAQ